MKHLFLFLSFCSLSIASFSQVIIKAKAGLNMSKMWRPEGTYTYRGNQVFKLGLNAGAAVEFPLRKKLSLQAELMYSLKGLKDTSWIRRGSYGDYKGYGYNFHCIELPLLLRMSLSKNFRVGFGPSITWLVKVQEIMENIDVTDPNRQFTKLDYGLNADVSYSFKRFEIGARYNHGFRMIKSESTYPDPEFPSMRNTKSIGKNRTMQIWVGWVFGTRSSLKSK